MPCLLLLRIRRRSSLLLFFQSVLLDIILRFDIPLKRIILKTSCPMIPKTTRMNAKWRRLFIEKWKKKYERRASVSMHTMHNVACTCNAELNLDVTYNITILWSWLFVECCFRENCMTRLIFRLQLLRRGLVMTHFISLSCVPHSPHPHFALRYRSVLSWSTLYWSKAI